MKPLFKISDVSGQLPEEAYSLAEILSILKDKTNLSFEDIFLWTTVEKDDRDNSIAELHFGVSDDEE